MFSDELIKCLYDCNLHHRDKNNLLKNLINERLNISLETYYHELEMSAEYLANRKINNIIKKY